MWCRSSIEDAVDFSAVGHTPIIQLQVGVAGRQHSLFLKDERRNPTGSVKDRAAAAIIQSLRDDPRLRSGAGLVESTSGNMGAALAFQASRAGIEFLAIVDPNLSLEHDRKIRQYGGRLHTIDAPDEDGNYLKARLSAAKAHDATGHWVWARQYSSRAIVDSHAMMTAPEIDQQVNAFDSLYVAVSTCGTLAGLGTYFRSHRPDSRVVAVDLHGSVAFGGLPQKRHLTGIGSARRPDFDVRGAYTDVALVTEWESIEVCRHLREHTGIGVGGSTGAVVAAFLADAARAARPITGAALIADGAENYESTIYDDEWLRLQQIAARPAMAGVTFQCCPTTTSHG